MNKEEFVKGYEKEIDMGCIMDDLTPEALGLFLDENPELISIMEIFKLGPDNLATIVTEIGGAEIYDFDSIWLFQILKEVVGCIPTWGENQPEVYDIETSVNNPGYPVYQNGTQNMMSAEALLGMKIHEKIKESLESYIKHPPSGDDTYFDYYPGEMSYNMAVLNWYLNDGPRMV